MKREPLKVIVHKPSDEEIKKLTGKAFAQIIIDRIEKLPEEHRLANYDAILEVVEKWREEK